MIVLEQVCSELSKLAPLQLAESWDNVGLLVGDRSQSIRRVMTCLTITQSVVDEAIQQTVDLLVTHHPLPFRPIQRLTSDQVASALLLKLIRCGAAVYSAHTAFDSAASGINQLWADALGLDNARPLIDAPAASPTVEKPASTNSPSVSGAANGVSGAANALLGSGRYGNLPAPTSFAALMRQASQISGACSPRMVGSGDRPITRVAIACGSGGSFIQAAKRRGCDAMLTGEATFHQCLEAEAFGISLGLLGHYASERFAMETLASRLGEALPELDVWPSRQERDPIRPLT